MKRKYEILTFASFITIIFMFFVCIALANTLHIKKGDINHDGSVDITDLVIVNRAVLGKETLALNYKDADMNDDGVIDQSDIQVINDIILGR